MAVCGRRLRFVTSWCSARSCDAKGRRWSPSIKPVPKGNSFLGARKRHCGAFRVIGNGFILPDLLPGHRSQNWGRGDVLVIPVEAVERVIDDFRTRKEKLEPFKGVPAVDAAIRVYNAAINELGKVVEDYGPGKP